MKKTAHVALAFKPTNSSVLTFICPKPDFKDRVSRDSNGDVTTDVEPFARRAADWPHLIWKRKFINTEGWTMGFKPIILFSKVHKIRVFTFKNSIQWEKENTTHKTRLGFKPSCHWHSSKENLCWWQLHIRCFLTYFMWNVSFLVQVVFRNSTGTSQQRTYKATIWKGSEALTFLQLPVLYRLEAFWGFHRLSTRSGIKSSAFFTLCAS